ncbi:MAG: diacylglycerol/lipid kinase family protein [Burkholderiales bacterium]
MPRIALIVNPASGRGAGRRLAPEVRERLGRSGTNCELQFTSAPGEMRSLVAAALREGADCVAVAGGDGSLNEAVNGYVGVAREDQALAVIPLGTDNDFAKMLGVGSDWRLACERIASGARRRIDAGRCNGHVFANGIGAGFDAQVALEANSIRWLRGNAVYGLALAKTLLLRYSTPNARIVHDGGAIETRITMLAAANGTTYGGAFRIAPGADIADGRLDLMVAEPLSRVGIIGFIPHVLRGTHVGRHGVTMVRTRRVVVETDEPLVVHADGEIIDRAARRLEVEVLPGALRTIA